MSFNFSSSILPPVVRYGQPSAMPEPTTDEDVVRINAPVAADVRNVSELQARIKKAGGAVIVGPNSSDYLVAVNNRLKFSVTRVGDDQFQIRESSNYLLAIGLAVVAGILLVSRAR